VAVEVLLHLDVLLERKLDKKEKVDSTLYPGQERDAWIVKYGDGTSEHFEEEELRSGKDGPAPAQGDGKPVLVVRDVKERDAMYDALKPGFDYLEARITGTCAAQYSLVGMYETCRLVRIFDPNFASQYLDSAYVDSMAAITPLRSLDMLDQLKQEAPLYRAAAGSAGAFDKSSVADYTDAMLTWGGAPTAARSPCGRSRRASCSPRRPTPPPASASLRC